MQKNFIPFVDLKLQNSFYKKKFLLSLSEILTSSNFIKSKYNLLLEKKICKTFKVKYALNVNSGTDALIIAIKSLNLEKKSEIITTSNTWISSAYAIALNDHVPVFVDINPDTLQMDELLLKKKLTKKTRAILVTHLYGNPCNMSKIQNFAKTNNLYIIEDIAQSHLACYKNKIVGNFGDISCLSFYPTKNLGALGDAGCIISNSKKIMINAKKYANYGALSFKEKNHSFIGFNSRMDEIQASFLNSKIKHLKINTNKRILLGQLYQSYCKKLKIKYIKQYKYSKNVYHLFPIIIDNRDVVKKKLEDLGIKTQIHYEIPIHLQKAFNYLGYKKNSLPITEKISKKILSLPFYPGIKKKKIEYIFNKLKKIIN